MGERPDLHPANPVVDLSVFALGAMAAAGFAGAWAAAAAFWAGALVATRNTER